MKSNHRGSNAIRPTGAIQRSRGCQIRKHPGHGYRVVMYYDNPGVYYDENGVQVSEELARLCGFEVEQMRVERDQHERRRQLEDEIREDATFAKDDVRASAVAALARRGASIEETSTPGMYRIVDSRGKHLVSTELTPDEARITYRAITGNDWEGELKGPRKRSRAKPKAEPEVKAPVKPKVDPEDAANAKAGRLAAAAKAKKRKRDLIGE